MAQFNSGIRTESSENQPDSSVFSGWNQLVIPSIEILQRMAGTTEDEFLQLGSQLQSFYQRSSEISALANQLVDVIAGDRLSMLTSRLQQMMADMESYLAESRARSGAGCATLEQVQCLLDEVSQPLEGFQKMNKTLRMLSISTKIESSRLGELGSGFSNLAMDVEKLSHQVNEKSADIIAHRQLLSSLISTNLSHVHSNERSQNAEVKESLDAAAASLQELQSLNDRCVSLGAMVAAASADVSANISEIVASQQFHDITRQQIEHVVEALERLKTNLAAVGSGAGQVNAGIELVMEAGDVCELQEAQLRFAAAELYTAVGSILENLRDVARKQDAMSHETMAVAGVAGSGGGSFVEGMQNRMSSVTSVLADCAATDRELAVTMKNVAATIEQITSFVGDIEDIGSEIDLIALNSQIKAAHTGREGAALGVLAEAIKRLSDEAVRQTEAVSATLTNIQAATEHIVSDSESSEEGGSAHIAAMEAELSEILQTLALMNSDMVALVSSLGDRVRMLSEDIEQATTGIDVHERTKQQADQVLGHLERIVAHARELAPASNEFKQNLKHMEERYTMESERHIHEAIARKRGVHIVSDVSAVSTAVPRAESEFGDNVDLF